LLNQKNNNSASGLSGYVSFNSPFNSPSNINSPSMLFSSVFSHYGFEQHLDPATVFLPLSLLSSNLSHALIVDSPYTDTEFEKVLLHFAYGSSSSSPLFPNISIDSPMSLEEFEDLLHSLHVFFSSSSHYYSLH
jgi:hypothetical protein